MKAVILAGGFGTRIEEETHLKPKPMIEIGGKPILWHIMKIYASYGINDFVICLGYKGYMIKEYFANYFLHNSDVTIDLKNNNIEIHQAKVEPWKITLVDTGENTMTGGRINRIKNHITDTFCLTYGDGVSNVDIKKLVDFHKQNKSLATLTAVQPPGRYGAISIKNNKVKTFHEKLFGDSGWINGGFFVFEKEILNYLDNDDTILEAEPLEKLASEGQLSAFMHNGFWRAMDTLKDKKDLEKLWQTNKAQWKTW